MHIVTMPWKIVHRLGQRMLATWGAPAPIPAPLWQAALAGYPFLVALNAAEKEKLRTLAALFLRRKRFHGAQGLQISDAMALEIAAQACLPLLHWGAPQQALTWYDDFVGIVVYPGAAVARRVHADAAGVMHHWREVLDGESMQDGPVVLNWQAVQAARGARRDDAQPGNVVIHEFAHKIDMRSGNADGCPPLPRGFMGCTTAQQACRLWQGAWSAAFGDFREHTIRAERFGGTWPWLDSYAASDPAEFFAVCCEAFFVARARFGVEFPELARLLAAFFLWVE